MSISFVLIGNSRGLLPFVGVMLRVLCSVDRLVHFSNVASDILIPVSLSVWSKAAMRFEHEAISWSSSVSVGMNGILVCSFTFGGFQDLPMNARKAVYVRMNFFCVRLFHCWRFVIVAFVASGFCRSVIFASWFNPRILDMIVALASPLFFMSNIKFVRSWAVFCWNVGGFGISVDGFSLTCPRPLP